MQLIHSSLIQTVSIIRSSVASWCHLGVEVVQLRGNKREETYDNYQNNRNKLQLIRANLSWDFRFGLMTLSLSIYNAVLIHRSRGRREMEGTGRNGLTADSQVRDPRFAARGVFVRARLASASAWKDSGAQ